MHLPKLSDNTTNIIKKRKLYRALTVSAVVMHPLYSYFLWDSACGATEFAFVQFGVDLTDTVTVAIKCITIPFLIANLICDTTVVDPLKDADMLSMVEQKREKLDAKYYLAWSLKFLAVVVSFPVGSASAALPIYDLTQDINVAYLDAIINFISLFVVAILGDIYFILFTNKKIKIHADEFVDTCKNFKDFLYKLFRNPGKYLEVFFQTFSNAIYRAIAFGYVMSVVLNTFFNIDEESSGSRAGVFATGIATFIVTLFSRMLSVRDIFLNPDYELLKPIDLKSNQKFCLTNITDILVSLIRGITTSIIFFEIMPLSGISKYIVSCIIGILVIMHSIYIRYINDISKCALAELSSEELNRRKNIGETIPLLSNGDIEKRQELFKDFSEKFDSEKINYFIYIINLMARIFRFIGFFLFLETVNSILSLHSDTDINIALTFLWGSEVFKNDTAFYQATLEVNWRNIRAKKELMRIQTSEDTVQEATNCSKFKSIYTLFKAYMKSSLDFPVEILENANLLHNNRLQ